MKQGKDQRIIIPAYSEEMPALERIVYNLHEGIRLIHEATKDLRFLCHTADSLTLNRIIYTQIIPICEFYKDELKKMKESNK